MSLGTLSHWFRPSDELRPTVVSEASQLPLRIPVGRPFSGAVEVFAQDCVSVVWPFVID